MSRVDDVVDDEHTSAGDGLVVTTFQLEGFPGIGSHPLGEDALNSQGQGRVLGADDAADGRSADQVQRAPGFLDGLGKHGSKCTRACRIHVDDVLGDPARAMITGCVDEVSVFDEGAAFLEHASSSLLTLPG